MGLRSRRARGRSLTPAPARRRLRSGLLATTALTTALGVLATPAVALDSPDGRAYELVTPAGGIQDIQLTKGSWTPSSESGNTVCFASTFPMAGAPPRGGTLWDDIYCSDRDASGWTTEWVSQPAGRVSPPSTNTGAVMSFLSEDGKRKIFTSMVPIEFAPPLGWDRMDSYLRADGATTWLTGPRDPEREREHRHVVAASADLSHAVTVYGGRVTERVGGVARAVSVDGGGNPVPGTANVEGSQGPFGYTTAVPGTISRDGSRIFFQAAGNILGGSVTQQAVYVRENGAVTRIVSPRDPSVVTRADITFVGASEYGDIAYLRTTEQLTSTAVTGTAVYRYQLGDGRLTLVQDRITKTVAVSPDGSTIFLIGTNLLDPADGLSLYVARGGTVRRITSLQTADNSAGGPSLGATSHVRRPIRFSPDGSVGVFQAQADTPGVAGVYRWSVADGLQLLSIDLAGRKAAAQLGLVGPPQPISNMGMDGTIAGRGLTDDGRTVFFTTSAALVSQDVNNGSDVYSWSGGRVRLITPGDTVGVDANYVDNSPDGSTVFFVTFQQVLPTDTNNGRDMYAARVGGGFPLPADTACTGDACQGSPTPSPSNAPPGSVTFNGPDDVLEPPARTPKRMLAVAAISRRARATFARTGRLTLRVTTTGGGRIVAKATGRIAGKRRTLASVRRGVSGTRRVTTRVTLRLSSAARRQLSRTGRLRLTVTVSLPGANAKKTSMTLTRKRG